MSITKHFEIQRQRADGTWQRCEIPSITYDRVALHEAMMKHSRSWPSDTFRLVMVTEIEVERMCNRNMIVKL